MPAGNYKIVFELYNLFEQNIAYWECPFQILGDFDVEAISPGVPFGAPLVVMNENPVFVWTGKCDSFRITIGIFLNFDLSPDEILEKYKFFEKDFGRNTYMFAYPREFPPFTAGNYVWRITGFVKTTSELQKI